MPSKPSKALRDLEDQAKFNHWHARNLLMLEAVISAMLDVDDHEGIAEILREHADQLEEFG